MIENLHIEQAAASDSALLTEIAFKAKRYWNYPGEYYIIWEKELTITGKYIEDNLVYKSLIKDLTVGFYSIVENKNDFVSGDILVKEGFWLEHLFISPEYHGMGIGRELIHHAKKICRNYEIPALLIFVDPFARGFYERIGAEFLYDSPSSISGRTIPVYRLIV